MEKLIGTIVFIGEDDIKGLDGTAIKAKDGKWYPARFCGYISFTHRVWCAWQVLIGRADIVRWKQQFLTQPLKSGK